MAYPVVYAGLLLALLVALVLWSGQGWVGDASFHLLVETSATLLALIVGVVALVRFYSKRSQILYVGVAFLGAGVLDGYHTVVTSPWLAGVFTDSDPIGSWSWSASRGFLSVFLLLGAVFEWREQRGRRPIDERLIYVLGGGIALSAGLVFAFWPYPSPYLGGSPIGRPQDVVWGILLMLTLVGHLREGSWRVDPFRHWLVMSLIVGITAQVAMAVSVQYDDAMFAAAHVLKNVSYMLVLVGLLTAMYRLFHMAEASLSRLEHMVTERTRELEARNEDLRHFASVAAHDLREPLTNIRMFGEELADATAGRLGGWAEQCLDRIRESATRMHEMIDALLALTQVTTRTQEFQPTDLNTVLAEVVSDISTRLESSGGRVVVGPLPTVDADAAQMRMLFQNLLVNAVKFQRDGVSPLVVVDAESRVGDPASGPGLVTVTVRDNGIGFLQDQADRIFEVFQRLHGRGEYEGTGIGLAISRRIAERHGGTITASSSPGNGAVFEIVLPMTQSA